MSAFSRFFIDRPVFAWVLAILAMLAGGLSVNSLAVNQYPNIAPPQVNISANYPGASAQTVQDTVTQVIEQELKGLDGLMYMSASSNSNGRASIRLSFTADTDPDTAQVQVQNAISGAVSRLPQEVQRRGVRVNKSSSDTLMVVSLISTDGAYTNTELGDFAESQLVDPLSRVQGVGDVNVFGSQHAMRIWLNPAKLMSYGLTPSDVVAAINEQNAQVSAGQFGALPAREGQQLNAAVASQELFTELEQFENIILRSEVSGARVLVKDVARVELGSDRYQSVARFNGNPSAGIGFNLAPGANALQTADAVKARLAELEATFPPGVSAVVAFDTTPFISAALQGVVYTLLEAVVLVFLVMYLFLQNLRATLIPTIAIPVVLLGTFALLSVLGYSINTLTMFGLVLAIGLLVDDAIVVVENVERLMREEGLSARDAAVKSMKQISGALVGITLVISAVLVPMAFFAGSTGVIYRQFSVTIVAAMGLSLLVALVLTPSLCATLLKSHGVISGKPRTWLGRLECVADCVFQRFNTGLDRFTTRYLGAVTWVTTHRLKSLLMYLGLILVAVWLFMRLPTSFLPEEDQGVLMTQVTLPAGATQHRTLAVLDQVQDYFLEKESTNVASVFTIAGAGAGASGQNAGTGFIRLKNWSERPGNANTAQSIAARAAGPLSQIQDGMVFVLAPPSVRGLGSGSGFEVQLQDRAGHGRQALIDARNQVLAAAAQDPRLSSVRPSGRDDTPQYRLDIDHARLASLGVPLSEVNNTLGIAWGGRYVNDYLEAGRIKRVYVQGDVDTRMVPEDLEKWFVRNRSGEMVPFSAFSSARWEFGAPVLERFNGVPSVQIQGTSAPGVSSGEAMQAIEDIVATLPPGFGIDWSGASYQEKLSGSQAPVLYALSILVVFLCLAALYESWSVPFAVILVVPVGVLGALIAVSTRGLGNDVYFQVGLLISMGLAARNAIMIVEFARDLVCQGMDTTQAALEACRMRLRPIFMTAISFGLGVLPLALATGAGSGSQNSIGTGVVGGTLIATLLGIFLTPLMFVVVQTWFVRKPSSSMRSHATLTEDFIGPPAPAGLAARESTND